MIEKTYEEKKILQIIPAPEGYELLYDQVDIATKEPVQWRDKVVCFVLVEIITRVVGSRERRGESLLAILPATYNPDFKSIEPVNQEDTWLLFNGKPTQPGSTNWPKIVEEEK